MFSCFSYRVLFQRFFTQNISLLPKIVTEAHANLKKKKTSCNTTLKHYAVMVKYTPLERSIVFFSIYYHQFIIKVHMGCGALLHSAFSPGALSFYQLKEGRAHALVRLVQSNS